MRTVAWTALVLVVAGAVVQLTAPAGTNADVMMLSLMSLRHLTPFYWGQDRYANVIPALASLIRDPDDNLMTVLWLQAIGFVLWLVVLAHLLVGLAPRPRTPGARLVAFVLLVWLTRELLTTAALWNFSTDAQPYAWSYVWLFAGCWLVRSAYNDKWAWLGAVCCLTLSVGMNPSVVVVLPVLFWAWRGQRQTVVALTLISGLVVLASKSVALLTDAVVREYGRFDLRHPLDHVVAAWLQLAPQLTGWQLASVLLLLALVVVVQKEGWLALFPAAWVLGLGAVWLVFFAQILWVQVNHYAVRYMFLPVFCLIVAATMLVLQILANLPPWIRAVALAGVMGRAAMTLWVAPTPLAEYPNLRAARADLALVPDHTRPLWLVGDYWRTWPALFVCLQQHRPCVSIAERAEDDDPMVLDQLRDESAAGANALCMGITPHQCVAMLQRFWGWASDWHPTATSDDLTAIQLLPRQPR